MPTKPTITADQRYMRTRSLSRIAAIATVMSGAANEMAVASTMGSRASAEKLQNMPSTLMRPRPTWPSGRVVRTAAASSFLQA